MVTGSIKCSVDWKSMMKVAKVLNKVCFYIMDTIVPRIGNGTVFGYGPCKYCEKCAFVTNEQCRFPDKRVRSLEGACIDVSEIAKLSGMQLKDEPDKISFFGLFVYNL
jgi:predicted metal-binding protein